MTLVAVILFSTGPCFLLWFDYFFLWADFFEFFFDLLMELIET